MTSVQAAISSLVVTLTGVAAYGQHSYTPDDIASGRSATEPLSYLVTLKGQPN